MAAIWHLLPAAAFLAIVVGQAPGDLTCVGTGIYGTTNPPSDLGQVYQVAMFHHACAITAQRTVTCWGTRAVTARGTVPGDLSNVKKVAVGAVHTCALTGTQQLVCWMGAAGPHVQDFGQAAVPDVVGSGSVIDFDAGFYHTCAIVREGCEDEGLLQCWGNTTNNQVPDDLGPVKQVACGMEWTVVLESSGTLRCFGRNAPTPPSGVFQSISLSLSTETACAMAMDGSVQCFKGALETSLGATSPSGCVHSTSQAFSCSGVTIPAESGSAQDFAIGMPEWGTALIKFLHNPTTRYAKTRFYFHEALLRCMQEPLCTGLACSAARLTDCDLRTGAQNVLTHSGSGTTTYFRPADGTQAACFVGDGSGGGNRRLAATVSTTTMTCTSTSTSTTTRTQTTGTETTTTESTSTTISTVTTTTTFSSSSSSSTSGTSTSSSSISSTTTTSATTSSSTSSTSVSSTSSSSTSSTTTSTVSSSSSSSSSSTSSTSVTSTSSTTTTTVSTTSTSSSSSTSTTSVSSTSSSSSSSTTTSTVTTSSSTTSTSTTSVTAPFLSGADELVEFFAELEAAALGGLWNSSQGSTKVERADVTMQVTKLPADGKEAVVKVEGIDAGATVPSSLLASFKGPVAAVISVFKGDDFLSRLQGVDSSGYETKLQSVMKMELHSPEGRQRVSGLAEPLLLQMPPVNKSSAVVCSYWDEASGRWAYDGLETTWVGDSLVCAATHLTLFAAILRGILTALACSQLTLFNAKAVQVLFNGKWLASPVGAAFILLLLFFCSLMLGACYVDSRRKHFFDELFLIPEGPGAQEEEPDHGFETPMSPASVQAASCLAACRDHTTMAAKEACTEIMSSFFESIGAFCEILGSCREACQHHRDLKTVVQHASAHLTLNSLRMQLGATSGFSDEAVDFAMGDDELLELFAEATETANREGGHPCRSLQVWYELHQNIAESLDHTWDKVGTCRKFPLAIWRLFLLINPFFSLYTINPFWSSALRLLILMVEMMGALLLGVFLFQNTAGAMDSESPDDCEAQGFWEQVGQMIVIGTASALFAALPAALLATLHHRKLVKCAYEGCEEWERQLRIWRAKDKILWFFGLLYVAFCLFVVALFLANMHPNDQPEWGVSGLTSLAEDALLVPIAMAIVVPLMAIGTVSMVSCLTGTRRADVLQSQREALEQEGTWMLRPGVGRNARSALASV